MKSYGTLVGELPTGIEFVVEGALHNRFPMDFFCNLFVFQYTIFLQNLLNFFTVWNYQQQSLCCFFSNNTIELLFENENIKMR